MTAPWDIRTYAALPSTQDEAKRLASAGAPEGTVVQCLEQLQGRGRHGRVWHSPPGNLYMSVLLRPGCPAGQAAQLSFVTALALADALDTLLAPGPALTLKWPNDILIDGKKISGILIEREGDSCIVGIGVNIFAPPEGAAALNACCGDSRPAIHPFRDAVLAALRARYDAWRENGFAPVRAAWLARAHGLNGPIRVTVGGREREGLFCGIGDDGRLLARTPDGKNFDISAGEVYFQPAQQEG